VFCPNVKYHCPEGALINTNFLRTRKDMPLLSDIYACCRLVWCNTCQLQILLKMLPKYYNHVRSYDNMLITIFFGVHRITLKDGRKVHIHILVTLLLFSLFMYAVVIYGTILPYFLLTSIGTNSRWWTSRKRIWREY
jgi:hypothetical protein